MQVPKAQVPRHDAHISFGVPVARQLYLSPYLPTRVPHFACTTPPYRCPRCRGSRRKNTYQPQVTRPCHGTTSCKVSKAAAAAAAAAIARRGEKVHYAVHFARFRHGTRLGRTWIRRTKPPDDRAPRVISCLRSRRNPNLESIIPHVCVAERRRERGGEGLQISDFLSLTILSLSCFVDAGESNPPTDPGEASPFLASRCPPHMCVD